MDKNKDIIIYNYLEQPKEITIEDIADINILTLRVITGDEQIVVRYKNGKYLIYDSSENRIDDFFDGEVDITLDELDEIKNFPSSYDALRYFQTKHY